MNPVRLLTGLAIVSAVVAVPLWLKHAPPTPALLAPVNVPPDGVPAAAQASVGAATPAPVKALPRFVDIGTTTCAPCRVMLGVMQELEAKYPDRLKVEFIHTGNDPEAAERLGIRTIPTQIFYAPDGKELFRHIGVMRTGDVLAKWRELGWPIEVAQVEPQR